MKRVSKYMFKAARIDFELVRDECSDMKFSVRLLAGRLAPLYFIILGVIALCVFHFRSSAPPLVVFGPSSLLAIAILARMRTWSRAAEIPFTRRRALATVVELHRVGPKIGLLFTSWMMLLYAYGNRADQGLVHLLTATTGIISVLCLGATPFAAILVACSVLVPSSIVYLSLSHPIGGVVAVVQAAIFATVIRIVFLYQSDLVFMARSRREIARREAAARVVADEESRLAHVDELTDLRNRRAFLEAISTQLEDEASSRIGLAILDLDGFKDINDSLGHVAGDRLLRVLAGRLMQHLPGHTIGRLGGDEFAILYTPVSPGGLPTRQMLEEVVGFLSEPIQFDGLTFGVGASLGYVEDACSELTVKECLERADHAMYAAKAREDLSVAIYGDVLDRQLRNRQRLVAVISQPGFEDFLSLAYQPIVDLRSSGIVGVEALTRWNSPGLEDIGAAEFIRLAESSGQMNAVTRQIVAKAASQCPAWRYGGSLFINISGPDLMRPGSLEALADIVTQAGAPPEHIVFEITETAIVNLDCAVQIIGDFRERGFRFALDDFGAGLSSLSRVHRLPINVLKVDGGFVENIVDDERCRAAVGTVIDLARQMKIDCVIEGIETPQQALHASRLGGRLMQGYLFGKPDDAQVALGMFKNGFYASPATMLASMQATG